MIKQKEKRYEEILIEFLRGINDNKYELTRDDFEKNNLVEFKESVTKELDISIDVIELLLIYLWQNEYLVVDNDGIKLTQKTIEELKKNFNITNIE